MTVWILYIFKKEKTKKKQDKKKKEIFQDETIFFLLNVKGD